MMKSPNQVAKNEVDLVHDANNGISMKKLEEGQYRIKRNRLMLLNETTKFINTGENSWTPQMSLYTDPRTMKTSLAVLKIAVISDAVNFLILGPNHPIMARSGAHPDSFDSTSPLGFSTAVYFLSLTKDIGAAVASVIGGKISDTHGRKPVIVTSLFLNAAVTIIRYFLKDSFWLFSMMNFCSGLCSSIVAIALAYMSDVHTDRRQKDAASGEVMALNLVGRAGGGIIAALISSNNLFLPLWVSASFLTIAGVLCAFLLIEPDKEMFRKSAKSQTPEDLCQGPETVEKQILWNIILGSLVDNFGSAGLIPLCLTPLMFEVYHADFVENGLSPIMSENAYKYIYVCISFVVIPGVLLSPGLFKRYGPALSCSVANTFTGFITIALLYISRIEPTTATFAISILILYSGFPLSVISQLSTGPMLDRISPVDQRGYIQGLNITTMQFSVALAPFLLSFLYDKIGAIACYWTSTGFSFLATLVNLPLTFYPILGPTASSTEDDAATDLVEDEDLIMRKLELAEYVPSDVLFKLNLKRTERGDPCLMTRYGDYQDDSYFLDVEHEHVVKEYGLLQKMAKQQLVLIKSHPEARALLVESINAMSDDEEGTLRAKREVGEWFADYLLDNGYHPGESSILLKHMIMTAFPRLTEHGKLTSENIEDRLLRRIKMLNNYIDLEGDNTSQEITTMLSEISLGGRVSVVKFKGD